MATVQPAGPTEPTPVTDPKVTEELQNGTASSAEKPEDPRDSQEKQEARHEQTLPDGTDPNSMRLADHSLPPDRK